LEGFHVGKKQASNKNKPARKTLKENEFYNPKMKRYEFHYADAQPVASQREEINAIAKSIA
jgi:hypothetical protein